MIDDHEAWAAADFPAAAALEVAERAVVHEEECVAELLNSGLETVGSGGGLVEAADFAGVADHGAVAALGADHEAGLHDRGEDQHCFRFLAEGSCGGVAGVE